MKTFLAALLISVCAVFNAIAGGETLWIDVRSAEEFDAAHLPGAVNIEYTDIADSIGRYATDKDQPIKLYCRSGRRAGIARQTLIDMGYSNVSNEGGYEALKQQPFSQPLPAN